MRLPSTNNLSKSNLTSSQASLKAAEVPKADSNMSQQGSQQDLQQKISHSTNQGDVDKKNSNVSLSDKEKSSQAVVQPRKSRAPPPPIPSRPGSAKIASTSVSALPADLGQERPASSLSKEVKIEKSSDIEYLENTAKQVTLTDSSIIESTQSTTEQTQAVNSLAQQPSQQELDEAQDIVPLIRSSGGAELQRDGTTSNFSHVSSNVNTQLSVSSAVTMADVNNAPARVDIQTGQPQDVDHTLNVTKFVANDQNSQQLMSVLKLEHKRMSASQKDAYRQYLTDFVAHYIQMDRFVAAQPFHYNAALIDQVFECITDDKNASLDKILTLLMILSRYSKSKGPNDGQEGRLSKIYDLLRSQSTSQDVIRESFRALINYAEANVNLLSSQQWMEALTMNLSSHIGDSSFLSGFMRVVRNMTVTEVARKQILDRMGFLIVNCINSHLHDVAVCENAFWVLGNCAITQESTTYFLSIGTFQALKQTMARHQEHEKVVEATLWFLFNITYDQQSIKIILKSLVEEHVIDAIKQYGASNGNILNWADFILRRIRAAVQVNNPAIVAERIANKALMEDWVQLQTGAVDDYAFQKFNKRYLVMLPGQLQFLVSQNDSEIQLEVKFKDVVDISTYPPLKKEYQDIKKEQEITQAAQSPAISPEAGKVAIDAVLEQEIPIIEPLISSSFGDATVMVQGDATVMVQGDTKERHSEAPLKAQVSFSSESDGGNSPRVTDVSTASESPSIDEQLSASSISKELTPIPIQTSIVTVAELQKDLYHDNPNIASILAQSGSESFKKQLTPPINIVQKNSSHTPVKFIKITTRQRVVILQGKEKSFDLFDWFTQLKVCWKAAVSSVTENASTIEKPVQTSFVFSVPETILSKDLEKVCFAHTIHEIYTNASYLTYNFKCQSKIPSVAIWDFLVAKLTRKLSLEFIDKKAQQFKNDRGTYDATTLKAELAKEVEDKLMGEVEAFENNPDVSDAPNVSTLYEYCAKQGIRPTMEDRHIHLPYIDYLLNTGNKSNPSQYYAVYDGHGGTHVAAFVETYLHYNLMKHPEIQTDIKKALSESFMKTQEELKVASDRLYLPTTAGSTAVVLYFVGKKMYCAWAGDSLASLFRKKEIIELVDPHKPGIESEKARIEKLGGFVAMEGQVLRVNGVVAVSRAFGNIRHRVIIPECDIKEIDLKGDEEYIVLACDGLWDVMTPQEVRQFVSKFMRKHGNRTKGISEALVDESLRLGSTDNVSVVFIEFRDWKLPVRS